MTPALRLAQDLRRSIDAAQPITGADLLKRATEAYGGTIGQGKFTPKDAYDALELAVNLHIQAHPYAYDPRADVDKAKLAVQQLEDLTARLPTHTRRTEEQQSFQQFSTPPAYAYAVNWIANPNPTDRVLEPSAGIGGLLVHAMNAQPREAVGNELSPRRAELLRALNPDRVFSENADHLNAILPPDVKPTVVVMNPPFSQTAGRMGDKKMTMTGANHVEQALQRLEPGGRLVAIVGGGMRMEAPTFRDWWGKIAQQYSVKANVGVGRDVYKKYGTSFPTRVLVIDKVPPTPGVPMNTLVRDVPDVVSLVDALKGVRDARPGLTAPQPPQRPSLPQPAPGQRGGPPASAGGIGQRPAEQPPVPAATGQLGTPASSDRPPEPALPDRATGGGPAGGQPKPADAGVLRPDAGGGGTDRGRGGAAGSGQPAGGGAAGAAATDAGKQPGELKVSSNADPDVHTGTVSEAVFDDYKPQKLQMEGPHPHGTPLVQSAAMAATTPPDPTYRPRIDPSVFKENVLSLPQMESIVYAGQAHEQDLPSGERRGFFIGDGTGVGKGQQIAGIFLDNFNRGRGRGVWVSENFKLHKDAQRDWKDVGGSADEIVKHNKFKPSDPIALNRGILFTGYKTLSKGMNVPGKDRVQQIVDWLGKDFEGVIAFDEAHNMKNAIAMKGKRGMSKPSDVAAAGIKLQQALPRARIVYVSATGATDVGNLAYADRLGLWGQETAFPNKQEFVNQIEGGGVAAMELVSRDMKAMGAYLARSLSFNGVKYQRLEHALTPEQGEIYDKLAEGWQSVLRNFNAALQQTAADHHGKVDGKAKANAMAQFWSTHQRFFNQVLTAMQMPSMIRDIEAQTQAGHAAVVQLVNTNEAAMDRQLAAIADDEDSGALDNIDLTPRQALMEMVQKSFPTQKHEEQIDPATGKSVMVPVRDSKGNAVHDPVAVAMRDKLLDELASIRVPEGPLEMLINHFGPDKVAENTGRSQRVVRTAKGTEVQPWSAARSLADVRAFLDDKKHILVFSMAGGTGASYHADPRFKNTRPRVHYLAQAGWIADKAVQGFGRTHRSNQKSAPLYKLVTTDLKGQKRFISTIARRLDQLGALSTGDRRGGGKGIFKPEDNLESTEARKAMRLFFEDLHRGFVPEMSLAEFEKQSGLQLINAQTGGLRKDLPEVPQFLNRILGFMTGDQDAVFDAYTTRLEAVVQNAIENGTLDSGVETVKADSIAKNKEQTVYTEPRSKAETKYVQLTLRNKNHPQSFEKAGAIRGFQGYAQNSKSGAVVAVGDGPTKTQLSGYVVNQYRLQGPLKSRLIETPDFHNSHWGMITDPQEARRKWEEHAAGLPTHSEDQMHLITGAVLPIWDRLGNSRPRVFRVQTDAGERMLGRAIPDDELDDTLQNLGVGQDKIEITPGDAMDKVLNQDQILELANGWRIKASRVGGEKRPEIIGPNLPDVPNLRDQGVQVEKIQFQNRYFVPTGSGGEQTLKRVLANRPIVRMSRRSGFVYTGWLDDVAAGVKHLSNSVARLGGTTFPAIKAEDRSAGEAGDRYIASSVYAQEAPPVLAQQIFGDDPEVRAIATALLVQDDLDGVRQGFLDAGKTAQADKVYTLIGAKDSPFQTAEDYQEWGEDERMQEAIERWKDWWQREPEQNYRTSQEIDPDTELPARGPRFGARTNLKALIDGAESAPAAIQTLSSRVSPRGNLANPLKKASPFARRATGAGKGYELDPAKLIANTLQRGTEIANQRRFYDALIRAGLAVYGKPGAAPKLGGKPTIGIDVRRRTLLIPGKAVVPQNQKLYVRSDLYPEVRQALNVDSGAFSPTLAKVADIANKGALAGWTEALYHLRNQLGTLVKTPGAGAILPSWIKNGAALLRRDPEIARQLVELARIGALKPRGEGTAANPLRWVGKAVEFSDRVGRLVLDDAFDKLAAKGLVEKTQANRTRFVNQFGQYNKRAQHRLIALARDTGLGPFATAGSNFYFQRLKTLTASPGVKASSPWAALRLRANVLMRYAAILAAVYALNAARKRRQEIGKIALDDGPKGEGRSLDVLDDIGIRGGLRASGVEPYLQEKHKGGSEQQARSAAIREALMSPIRPAAGPLVQAGFTAATGSDFEQRQAAPKVGRDQSQAAENLKAAFRGFNPIIKAFTSGRSSLGPFGTKSDPNANRSEADILARRLGQEQSGERQMTEAERQRYQKRQEVEGQMRQGDGPAVMREKIAAGELTRTQAENLLKRSKLTDLQEHVRGLSVDDAMQVWHAASDKEQDELRGLLRAKIWRSRSISADTRRDLLRQVPLPTGKSATPVD